jgi:hypothetical protein
LSLDPEALRARFRAARTGQQLNLLRLQLTDAEARALMKDPELSHLEKSTASLAKAFRGPIPRPFDSYALDSHIIDGDELNEPV